MLAFLNGQFSPLSDIHISPLDRGFLFGDGVYEVIPYYDGAFVGLELHLDRLLNGLAELEIETGYSRSDWLENIRSLVLQNEAVGSQLGVYLQVTRGADVRRFHAYPDTEKVSATIFMYVFEIPSICFDTIKTYRTTLAADFRWGMCHIKSTSLLGNVMLFQRSHCLGLGETILYNRDNYVTEASSSNVFCVKNNVIFTPPLDSQILPGVTRLILLSLLKKDDSYEICEGLITVDALLDSDEVWLTSSTKGVVPVVAIDGYSIGNGAIGDVYRKALSLYVTYKHDYF